MVKIFLKVSIFKDALILKLCSVRWHLFTLEDSVKWYECYYYVLLLDSNFRQTASYDWHNKLCHYDGTFSNSSGLLSKLVLLLAKRNTFSHQISFRAVCGNRESESAKSQLIFVCNLFTITMFSRTDLALGASGSYYWDYGL